MFRLDQQRLREPEPYTEAMRSVAAEQAAGLDTKAAEGGRRTVRGCRQGITGVRGLCPASGLRAASTYAAGVAADDGVTKA